MRDTHVKILSLFKMASVLNAFVSTVYCSLSLITFLSLVILVNGESEIITEDSYDMMFKGQWMVKFYAPWCPACRNLRPIWDKFAIKAETLNLRVGEVDVTKNTALSGRFGITSLPTIYHVMNGELRLYKEKRRLDDMVAFIEHRTWENVKAIPSWKSPNSILMKGLGMVFKVSVVLKDTHSLLTETYGLPAWCSYVFFGVVTVLIGLIIGVVLVFITDYVVGKFWPAPVHHDFAPPGEDDELDETKEDIDEDKEIELEHAETTNVRKRAKKLKATME